MIAQQDLKEPKLHDDAPKRVMRLCAVAVEIEWSRVFTRSSGTAEVTQRCP
jgi:hypothetical protein